MAGEDLYEQAVAGERAFLERLGGGLVEDAWPARAGALLALCRDEACRGKNAKVRADGVPVQTDACSKLTGVKGRLASCKASRIRTRLGSLRARWSSVPS